MKIVGNAQSREVWLDGVHLSPKKSQKIVNHSPDGFAWGYGGSGPSQLALAILLETTDQDTATKYYQDFKWEHVSKWEGDFEVEVDVKSWLEGRVA